MGSRRQWSRVYTIPVRDRIINEMGNLMAQRLYGLCGDYKETLRNSSKGLIGRVNSGVTIEPFHDKARFRASMFSGFRRKSQTFLKNFAPKKAR